MLLSTLVTVPFSSDSIFLPQRSQSFLHKEHYDKVCNRQWISKNYFKLSSLKSYCTILKSKNMRPLITIVGMGPGVSQAVAEKFGQEGYQIAMIARNSEKLQIFKDALAEKGLTAEPFSADAGDAGSLQEAFEAIRSKMGDTSVLLYNAAVLKRKSLIEENMHTLTEDFKVNVGGALEAVKAVIPAMQANGEGTLLFTGGGLSLNPSPLYGSLAVGKAGMRNLVGSLFAHFKNTPIKIATVTVAGIVTMKSERHNPAAIAEEFWKLHQTPKEELKFEVVY